MALYYTKDVSITGVTLPTTLETAVATLPIKLNGNPCTSIMVNGVEKVTAITDAIRKDFGENFRNTEENVRAIVDFINECFNLSKTKTLRIVETDEGSGTKHLSYDVFECRLEEETDEQGAGTGYYDVVLLLETDEGIQSYSYRPGPSHNVYVICTGDF